LKLRLSSAEGKNAGLENQLNKIESGKNQIEFKLNNLYSTLRRTLGIRQQPQSVSSPSQMRYKSAILFLLQHLEIHSRRFSNSRKIH